MAETSEEEHRHDVGYCNGHYDHEGIVLEDGDLRSEQEAGSHHNTEARACQGLSFLQVSLFHFASSVELRRIRVVMGNVNCVVHAESHDDDQQEHLSQAKLPVNEAHDSK